MSIEYPELFEPIQIGQVTIKNRYMLAPMGPAGLCDELGGFNQRGVEFYVERARGGAGMIMPGVTKVENEIERCQLPAMPCPTVHPSHFIQTARPMNERIHAYQAKSFLQLSAGFGRVGMPGFIKTPPIAPSAIPHRWVKGVTCRALSIEEIQIYIEKFAQSAEIAMKSGFDGVEIHAVHEGYLLDQFAIAMFNQREDQYGGSLVNRLRFACEIVAAIKARCGADYPVSLRYSLKSFIKDWCEGALPGEKFVEKGRDIEEGIEAAKLLVNAGYDALNVDVGCYDAWYWNHPPMYQQEGLYLPYSEILKKEVDVPIITAGRMDNPELARQAIVQGKTDMVGLGRPLLADSELPNKVMQGNKTAIRPCLSCQEGCMGRLEHFSQLGCAVNPQAARESDYILHPSLQAKQILIVGGGVAGLECARVSALRGHHVTLCEASDQLGGVVIAGGMPEFKADDHKLLHWYRGQLKQLHVTIELNTRLTAEQIIARNADEVILATGSIAKTLPVPSDQPILLATDVLLGNVKPQQSVAIVGAGLVGCELALWLAQHQHQVYLIESAAAPLAVSGPLCDANQDMLLALIKYQDNIEVLSQSQLLRASEQAVVVQTPQGEREIACQSLVAAIGYHSDDTLYQQLRTEIANLHMIGDARQVQNIMYAIWDGFEVARTL
ncbi:oxidoreductase [Celerinatantimonas diazotrophica]|uniref:2-enoate reductase n=1 Tax=Celerinatantimonas diazotrophica TaxID=412034 RepID=A0A4R1K299_9GAMM|nr:FAD-dependent oxidoreductase [Celerinatantimonas diazotrophica]TCK58135.1 2-enoate reductase [Celerinatantimonas diazotrophica]CAG9297793.1 Cinnamate reductase [Celerinatantimonas diazotrophica]